ncbi:hypothetical protein OAL60_00855 [bacterium]|nr:hypothetical protein [bacterium]
MGFADEITGELENIETLWHQTPDSWQGASAGQESHAELAARFLYLMGNQTDFRLVISILGPDAKERKKGGVFSDDNEKLISLLSELEKVGVCPKLVYHPGLQKESTDWGNGGLKATTDDMATFNQSIATYNTNNNTNMPVFTEYLLEGADFGKNSETMNSLQTLIAANPQLDSKIELWSTGEWQNGVTLEPPYYKNKPVKDSGVYMQLYDFDKYDNKLSDRQTNPSQAELLGKDFVDVLTGQKNAWNKNVFEYPDRAIQTFTFYDDDDIKHAPGFYGSMTTQPWDVDEFNTFTKSFSEQFKIHSTYAFANSGQMPLLAIWHAESALNTLSPDPSKALQEMFGNDANSVRIALNL